MLPGYSRCKSAARRRISNTQEKTSSAAKGRAAARPTPGCAKPRANSPLAAASTDTQSSAAKKPARGS